MINGVWGRAVYQVIAYQRRSMNETLLSQPGLVLAHLLSSLMTLETMLPGRAEVTVSGGPAASEHLTDCRSSDSSPARSAVTVCTSTDLPFLLNFARATFVFRTSEGDRFEGDRFEGDRFEGDRYEVDRFEVDRFKGDRFGDGVSVRLRLKVELRGLALRLRGLA